jgi:hypothetical protein
LGRNNDFEALGKHRTAIIQAGNFASREESHMVDAYVEISHSANRTQPVTP